MKARASNGLLRSAATLALASAALAGCGFLGVPPFRGAPVPAEAPAAARAPAEAGPGMVTVQPGDSVYLIARRNNVPIRVLIEANHLAPPYVLRPGQQLAIPHPQLYVVKAGDTLYGIARQNGVDSSALVRANDLKPPYKLLVGRQLVMPGRVASDTTAARPAPPAEIERVDLLKPPAERAGAGVVAAPQNTAAAPSQAESRSGIVAVPILPPPAVGQAATDAPASVDAGAASANARVASTPATPAAASAGQTAAPPPQPQPPAAEAAEADGQGDADEPAEAAAPPSSTKLASLPTSPGAAASTGLGGASGGRFAWPVHGRILSGFGVKEGGLHNDGINIAVKQGATVVAADDGVVVYAGNEIRGFGNLVLVKHANGWMTAYAHNAELLVKRGEPVKRGQAISKAGATGGVASPQLHFEVRRGSRAVDPSKYLASLSS